ncbi:MAG: acyl-CoA dehydrogenase family protein [Canibacter sp.]
MTSYNLDEPLDFDYFNVFQDVPEADRAWWQKARDVGQPLLTEAEQAWESAAYPMNWVTALGEAGLYADGIDSEYLPKLSPLAAGLVAMELHRVDGSLGTILGVQGGLAMRTIAMFGSDEQQARYIPAMATGEELGSFALTEPTHGSDSTSLETSMRIDGDEIVLNGEKKWIGNGASGGITVVFCRDEAGDVRGVLVPQDTPGYEATVITGKVALRAIHQAEITFTNVRVPKDNLLPRLKNFKDVSAVLFATRVGVAWAALGHATAVFEAALTYAQERIQFGKPLVKFQLVQERLTEMLSDLTGLQLYCKQLATLDAARELTQAQASLGKYTATRSARRIASTARDMLGGNGILLEHHVIRHAADLEALHTYEGTESVQALLVGRDITGTGAFV